MPSRKKTIGRETLAEYLDEYLDVAAIPDDSPNGLQVQGAARVSKIAYAVDASVQTIRAAVRSGAEMLVVHHGLFWGPHQQIVGTMYKRVALLVKNDVSLYAAHLPLDCHPEIGNNVELARLFGLEVQEQFAEYKGTRLGTLTRAGKPLQRNELKNIVERALGAPVDVLPFGPAHNRRIGVISGGAARFAEEAKRIGCDALVTGESSHSAYHMARDAGINLYYGGHYATETVGLKALSKHLKENFGVPGRFIPAPTGY
jgi:dinuclear metal center YbgI/SA1388 family protein